MPLLPPTLRDASFGTQVIVLALFFDGLGAALGYLLHEPLGVEPIMGVAYGIVAGSLPVSMFVMRHAAAQGNEANI